MFFINLNNMKALAQLVRSYIEREDVDFDHLFPNPTRDEFKKHMKDRHNAHCILEIINTIDIIEK